LVIIGTAAVTPRTGVARQRRRDRDDAPAGLLCQHLLDGELGDVQETFEVRRGERLEVLGRVVREPLGEEDAGIIDQGVDRPEASQRRLDDLGRSCGLADVAVHQGDAVGSRDLAGLRHLPGTGDDVKTAFNKRFHDACANPLRSSRHDGCLSLAAHGLPPNCVVKRFKKPGASARKAVC
jgi:hypothetical protein